MTIRTKTIVTLLAILNVFFVFAVYHSHERANRLKRELVLRQGEAIARLLACSCGENVNEEELSFLRHRSDALKNSLSLSYIAVNDSSNRVVAATGLAVGVPAVRRTEGVSDLRVNGRHLLNIAVPLLDDKGSIIHFGFDGAPLDRMAKGQVGSAIIMFLVMNAVTILLLSFFVPLLTRPISELVNLTRRMKFKDFDIKPARRKDEFGELQRSFLDMGQELGATIADLQKKKDFFSSFTRFYTEQAPPADFRSAKLRSLEHVAYNFKGCLAAIGVIEPGHRSVDILCHPLEQAYPKRLVAEVIREVIGKGITIQHTLIASAADGGYHAAVFEPLQSGDRVYGALGVLSSRAIGEDDVLALRLMARASTNVFNNLILLGTLRDQGHVLKEIYAAGVKIAYSMDVNTRITQTIDLLIRLFSFKRVTLFLVRDSVWDRHDGATPVPVRVDEAAAMVRRLRGTKIIDDKLFIGLLEIKDELLGYVFADREGHELEVAPADLGHINIFLNHVAVSLANARLFVELDGKCRELSGVHDISNSFSATRKREDIFGEMVERIARLTGSTKVLLSLHDRDSGEIVGQLPGYGVPPDLVRRFRFPLNEPSVAKEIFTTGLPYCNNEMADDKVGVQRFIVAFGLKRLVAVPLKVKGEVTGILYAANKENDEPFTETDVNLFTIFANQAGTVIENIRLYEEMQRRIHDLAMLNEMQRQFSSTLEINDVLNTIVRVIQEKTNYEFCGIGLYEEYSKEIVARAWSGQSPDANVMIRTPLGKGIVGNAVLVGEPILVPDVSKDENYINMIPGVRSELAMPIKSRGRVLGILDIESREVNAFSPRDVDFLKTVANVAGMAIDNALLFRESETGFIETVKALVMMIDANDPYTRGHSERVMNYATQIAGRLGLSEDEATQIRYAALLHDIGKIGISEAILAKRGELTDDEIDEVKLHPLIGAQMLDEIKYFKKIRFLIRSHHEFYNGGGYPYGLKGEAIPQGARIIAVADTYEALTSDRPYRPAFSRSHAVGLMKENAGTKLDPALVEVFMEILKEEELEGV